MLIAALSSFCFKLYYNWPSLNLQYWRDPEPEGYTLSPIFCDVPQHALQSELQGS